MVGFLQPFVLLLHKAIQEEAIHKECYSGVMSIHDSFQQCLIVKILLLHVHDVIIRPLASSSDFLSDEKHISLLWPQYRSHFVLIL